MDTKTRPIYICCLEETHFRPKHTYRMKVRGWKNIFPANGKQKEAGVAILISDKIDKRQGHYIMTEGSIQEDNTYAPNRAFALYIEML